MNFWCPRCLTWTDRWNLVERGMADGRRQGPRVDVYRHPKCGQRVYVQVVTEAGRMLATT